MKIWFCLFVHLLHFAYAYPIAPAQFVEKIIIFPIKSYWHVYQKLITIYVWIYFWTLLYCLSISMDVLYCLDYYCTVSWNLLIFFLYFKCALAILGPVHIHIHFKITSFSTRTLRKYNWDCIESIGQLVDNYNLFIIYEQGIFLYSLRFFFWLHQLYVEVPQMPPKLLQWKHWSLTHCWHKRTSHLELLNLFLQCTAFVQFIHKYLIYLMLF